MQQPARLTSDLLARRGRAFPTGGLAYPGIDLSQPLPAPDVLGEPRGGSELTIGAVVELPARPVTPARQPARRRRRPEDGRVALTLRLDRERHLRLKIFAARRNRSSQDVLVRALDAYLEACGADCACLRGGRCTDN
jgi:hypothetical protein